MRVVCRMILEGAGYAVETAGGGAEAVRRVLDIAPDLVVCDLSMPEMDGIETTGRLAKAAPGLPVVAMSVGAGPEPDVLAIAKRLGVVAVLSKPFTSDQLLAAVRSALGGDSSRGIPRVP